MKYLRMSTLIFPIISTTAFAGCADYEDGSISEPAPQAILCYKGKCDITHLSLECGNIHGAHFIYGNGLVVDIGPKGIIFSNKLNKKMKRDEWTCEPITKDGCRF